MVPKLVCFIHFLVMSLAGPLVALVYHCVSVYLPLLHYPSISVRFNCLPFGQCSCELDVYTPFSFHFLKSRLHNQITTEANGRLAMMAIIGMPRPQCRFWVERVHARQLPVDLISEGWTSWILQVLKFWSQTIRLKDFKSPLQTKSSAMEVLPGRLDGFRLGRLGQLHGLPSASSGLLKGLGCCCSVADQLHVMFQLLILAGSFSTMMMLRMSVEKRIESTIEHVLKNKEWPTHYNFFTLKCKDWLKRLNKTERLETCGRSAS